MRSRLVPPWWPILTLLAFAPGCASAPGAVAGPAGVPGPVAERAPDAARGSPQTLVATAVPLPGAAGSVILDYLAVDRRAGRVWVPAGNTGSVDVIDASSGRVTRTEGFTLREATLSGKRVLVGPSSATVGDGVVYVGNRGDGKVCALDAASAAVLSCFPFASETSLASTPDGLAYVAATREVWVTVGAPPLGLAPAERAVVVLDASTPAALRVAGKVTVPGRAEGYAVDEKHGRFYTNLEDADRTVAVDLRSRAIVATWSPGCGPKGPRGLAVDSSRQHLFVACTNGVVVLDAGSDGRILARAETGAGVDNIDYVEAERLLYAAAGAAERLDVFRVGEGGALELVAGGHTARGARVVVADAQGRAYVADSGGGRILVFEAPAR